MLKIPTRGLLFIGTLFLAAASAQAAYIDQFTPQGEVADASRATAVFNEDMVALGDTTAPAPFQVRCAVEGQGRWSDARTWVYQLPRDLDPGEQCRFQLKPALKSLKGHAVVGQQEFLIRTPGPWVQHLQPYPNGRIEEDQVFLITPRMPVTQASVEAHAWCESDGVGERLPLKWLPEAEFQHLLSALKQSPQPGQFAAHCAQRLAPGAHVRLVWGKGVESTSGARVRDADSFKYEVRVPFRAEFTCERERPAAPCSPLSDLRLTFTDQVSWQQAKQVRLVTPQGERAPWRAKDAREDAVSVVVFKGPFASGLAMTLRMPANLIDLSGRPLSNASSFPLKTGVGALPPLAKFSSGFGVLELKEGGVLPVTLRNLEGKVAMRWRHQTDPESALQIMRDLARFERQTRTLPRKGKPPVNEDEYDSPPPVDVLYPRELSYLTTAGEAPPRLLPKPNGAQAFEVVGIPLQKPGFYVVELESQLLGAALLTQPKPKQPRPMYVRTSALVTDMAVHFKKGRDSSLVWVTSLSTGKPVLGAVVRIENCRGSELWRGRSDAQGRAAIDGPLEQRDNCEQQDAVFYATAHKGQDFSFARSDWNRGIEPWRFNVDTWATLESPMVHTILDRTLLRAGETVSMKHIARRNDARGFAYPDPAKLPASLTIALMGGEETFTVPLTWDARGVAVSQWKIPETAKLGTYEIRVLNSWQSSAEFRVSDFRLPAYKGAITSSKPRMGGVKAVPMQLSLAYLNGGGARGQRVAVSGMLSPAYLNFRDYREFNFSRTEEDEAQRELVADKVEVTLDQHGLARTAIPLRDKLASPMRLTAEMTFPDPNGEIQTISSETELWPAEVAVGLRLLDEGRRNAHRSLQAVVLDLAGKPVSHTAVRVRATRHIDYTHRKRILGGFYSYETQTTREDMGLVCDGKTDARGLMTCDIAADKPGNIHLQAEVRDARGNVSQAGASFWSSGDGDVWFDQEDRDRMEIAPAKREYQAGETARLTVHTPFREATALIAVEREGVLETFVRPLKRHDPIVEIPVRAAWGPNVFVSVLAVRGRLREVPWYSFLQWGWRSPAEWVREYRGGVPQPTAMVDLARPGFKFGLTELQVGKAGAELKVRVEPDKSAYAPRATAKVKVRVAMPNGKAPPAGSEVAVAAVDRALLELSPNPTWNLLDAMRQEHAYLVETSTAQMQVVGKRHFGKKALPAGGGGGKLSTRELFDTLLYWNPRVKLDAKGEATVSVPLNDSLTAFKLVAIADVGPGLFGTGDTEIVSKQDLQITSGITPYIREGDRYRAGVTVRNGAERTMQVTVAGHAGKQALSAQKLRLEAGGAQEVAWQLQAPEGVESLQWQVEAIEQGGKALDRIKLTQKIAPRVPVTVQQATFMRLEQPYAVLATPPAGALPGKGGIEVTLSASLAGQTTELRRYFERYPFSCLEQRTSVAVGLHDEKRWQEVAGNLQGYLDAQGFAQYFPGAGQGSDALTAHLLSVTHAAGFQVPDEPRQRMEQALANFVAGKAKPSFWTPREILPERRLHALEALVRIGKADARMLGAFEFKPLKMPTASLIDWYSILYRVKDAPEREARLAAVERELRNRMTYAGGRLVFSTERDDRWWWLMMDGEVNALRLLEVAIDDPAWKQDVPALLRGAMLRQSRGHWGTTTANVWGVLALDKFGQRFEAEAVGGKTQATLTPAGSQSYAWKGADKTEQGKLSLPWSAEVEVAKPASFAMRHEGAGQPWATVMLKAAVPDKTADFGYKITRHLTPVEQKVDGRWSRGDVVRVRVEIESAQSMSWVVVSDPTSGGAAILGNTARDSAIAREGENDHFWEDNDAWPTFTERGFGFFRAYYDYVPKGKFWVEYTVRLNNAGEFALPATRVEAMYAPEVFGEIPNTTLQVSP